MTAVASAPARDELPGTEFPLGATPVEGGTNFAVASGIADAVTLCLFDDAGRETQVPLRDYDAGVWHGFVPGVGPGQAYGYRVAGQYDPARGWYSNPAKLLLDPYAKAISGAVAFGPEVLGYSGGDLGTASMLDSAGHVPRSLVVDPAFRWTDAAPVRRRYSDTIIYEMHVKGFTMRHPGVPEKLRGTYAGLAHEAAIGYLTDLGVTAVELLPVHHSVPESFLPARGLTNYWGYNTVGYFAPNHGYSAAVRAGPAARWPSSRPWWTRCTRPASRCCSTWCSTTPAKPARAGPRCASAAWTIPRTTGSTRPTRAGTSTPPAAGTR